MKNKERKNLEYKEEITNSFLKTISAYANYGTGKIIFGVSDDGKVVGISSLIESCLNIENKINDSIKPVPKYTLSIDDKTQTIILTVFESYNKPYLFKNKAYNRNDTSTVEVNRTEFGRLILEGNNINYESLPSSNQNLMFNDLNQLLNEKMQIENIGLDIYKTLNLYSNKEGYNKAAEFLSDTNSLNGINIVRYGKNENIFMKRIDLDNISILDQFNQSMIVFKDYYVSEIVKNGKRETFEILPSNAFREAIANAIVHRNYDINAAVKVSLFNDKIEIVSPGGLPDNLTREDYVSGRYSELRNPIIANVFYRLKYIEKFATGIKRIIASYDTSITKPSFIISESSIKIILPIIKDLTSLSKQKFITYKAVLKFQPCKRIQLEKELNFNKDKTLRLLNELIKENLIFKEGNGPGTEYKVKI